MKIEFGKDTIKTDKLIIDLNDITNEDLFKLLEYIIENKDKIVLEKKEDITPLSEKFYEIINQKLTTETNEI
ncbi:MAG: hypothetical protein PHX03_01760 [Bacilli bacterium]|nr:hypothetical protein [Bacilli bacterium]MDD4411067.1 hypothetical protein [Bacilli bacterium]